MKTLTIRKLQNLLKNNDLTSSESLVPWGLDWIITLKIPYKGRSILRKFRIPRVIAGLLCSAYHKGRINQQKAIQKELGL